MFYTYSFLCLLLRIKRKEWLSEELFHKCIEPIWHYGKNDPFIQQAMHQIMQQLSGQEADYPVKSLFGKMLLDTYPLTS